MANSRYADASHQGPQYPQEQDTVRKAIQLHLGKRIPDDDTVAIPIYFKKSTMQFHVYANHPMQMRGVYVPKLCFEAAPARLMLILAPLR